MDIKVGSLLGGFVGVVGATSAAFISGNDLTGKRSSASSLSEQHFCMINDAPFFNELKKGQCYSGAILPQLYKRDIIDNQGNSVIVTMSSPPASSEASDNCRTCNDYLRMTRLGWFALTNRDQRREEFFYRACGMLEYLEKGEKAEQSFFSSSTLNEIDAGAINRASLPQLSVSESGATANGNENVDQEVGSSRQGETLRQSGDGSWKLSMRTALGTQHLTIQPLSRADFNGDSVEDILVFIHAGLEQGTAINGTLGLLTKTSSDGAVQFVAQSSS